MRTNRYAVPVFLSFLGTALIFSLFLSSTFSLSQLGTLTERDSLKQRFVSVHKTWPGERIFITNDKPLYNPGETIWFSVFLVEETLLRRPALSEIVYVEILGPKGSVEKQFTLIARGGKANGDFPLSPDAVGGMYKIKAFTRWMQQQNQEVIREIQVQETVLPTLKLKLEFARQAYKAGDELNADFEVTKLDNSALANADLEVSVVAGDQTLVNQKAKTDGSGKYKVSFPVPPLAKGTVPVLNILVRNGEETESITKTIPIVEKDLLVYFFPEGGDFVQGLNSKIAFKVMKPDSTSADAEGWLTNQKGDKIQYVKTLHRGMGFVNLNPKAGELYKIEWKSPVEYTSPLPEPLEKGYGLAAKTSKEEVVIRIQSPVLESVLLVAQMRGKWLWDKAIRAGVGQTEIKVTTKDWPAGVVQFTLFDARKLPRCERLVFVNSDKHLNLNVKTDKARYQTREKVNLSVRATDERGLPVPGLVSVSVVNDALLSYADDKQSNILSSLLLEQDLNTKIENPDFYFSKDAKAPAALDLVMMTYGWRGFTWKKMLEETIDQPASGPEKAVLAGTLVSTIDGKPMAKAKLEIGKIVIYTDTAGHFKFPFIDLTKPAKVKISKGAERVDEQTITTYSDQMLLYYSPYSIVYRPMDNAMMPQEMAMVAGGGNEDDKMAPRKKMAPVKMVKEMAPPPVAEEKVAKNQGKAEKRKIAAGAPAADMIMPRPPRQPPVQEQSPYYLARIFPNLPPTKSAQRTDFKTTLFWSGIVDLDANGRGSYSFYTGDDISSYKAVAQGIGPDGLIGIGEHLFYTELPFSISAKLPVELSMGDDVILPIALTNKTNKVQMVQLSAVLGKGFKTLGELPQSITLNPKQTREIGLRSKAIVAMDSCKISLKMKAGEEEDIWERTIRIVPRGYPVNLSFSGREMSKNFNAEIKNMIPGSLTAHATAFPDVTSDLLAGVESILSEPFGCFEQTSMTSYPNVLVLNYLRQTNKPNPALVSNAEVLLEKGYKKLTSFETKQKGYEWFGGTPAHEALTAYGLMQFKEMQKVAPYVDASMVDRTADWLMSRRDGKGGFLKSAQALDNFGRASDEITNAYIVYSLAEAGSQQLDLEVKKTTEVALQKKDPYLLALAANTLWLLKQNEKAREVTRMLIQKQAENGSWTGLTHSITYSQGEALTIETTGFSILALIRSDEPDKMKIDKAVKFMCDQRKGQGGFGNSQATIVALKALTAYVVFSKRAAEDGAFSLAVNEKDVAKADWKAGTQKAIVAENWAAALKEGQNKLEFTYSVLKDPLPFTVGINYFTSLPPSDPTCKVKIYTTLSGAKVTLGKPLQMTVNLKNSTAEGLPMTMAAVSIPGGCVVSPVQFKELMTSKKIDFYEVRGNKIFLYYRQMSPSEEKNITLTLTPVIKGNYEASASSAYLYYTAEKKDWAKGLNLVVE